MTKRRIISALITIAMVLSLSACNSNKNSDSTEGSVEQNVVATTTETTASTTAMTVATTTTSVQTTTAPSTTQVTAVTYEKTVFGNEIYLSYNDTKLKLHKLKDMYEWVMNKGSMKDEYYTELYINTEILDVGYTILDTRNVPYEGYEKSSMPYGKLKYKDMTVTYFITSCPELENIALFSRIHLYLDLPDNKTLFVSVSPAGEVLARSHHYGITTPWIIEHKELYDSLTNDPEDYLYLFDAVELSHLHETTKTTTTKVTNQTTAPSSPDRTVEISNKNIKLKLHGVDGFSQWSVSDGTKDSIGHYATCRSELLDVEIVLVPTEVKNSRMEDLKKRGAKTYQETYKGRTGTAIEMLEFGDELTKRNICSGLLIYFPWGNDLYLTLSVLPAGELLHNGNLESITKLEKCYDDNIERYRELSSDPLDYLYILDVIEIK